MRFQQACARAGPLCVLTQPGVYAERLESVRIHAGNLEQHVIFDTVAIKNRINPSALPFEGLYECASSAGNFSIKRRFACEHSHTLVGCLTTKNTHAAGKRRSPPATSPLRVPGTEDGIEALYHVGGSFRLCTAAPPLRSTDVCVCSCLRYLGDPGLTRTF